MFWGVQHGTLTFFSMCVLGAVLLAVTPTTKRLQPEVPLVTGVSVQTQALTHEGVLTSRLRGAKTYTCTCFSGTLANHRSGFAFGSCFGARFVLVYVKLKLPSAGSGFSLLFPPPNVSNLANVTFRGF